MPTTTDAIFARAAERNRQASLESEARNPHGPLPRTDWEAVERADAPYAWLNSNACEDDIIPGATFVGDAAGTRGTDWQVYDEAALRQFIEEL